MSWALLDWTRRSQKEIFIKNRAQNQSVSNVFMPYNSFLQRDYNFIPGSQSWDSSFKPLLIEGFSCTKKKGCKCSKCKTPVDCVLSEWEMAGACSSECGPGTAKYVRYVISDANETGYCSPTLEELRPCNMKECPPPPAPPPPPPAPPPFPVDCQFSDWAMTGTCSASCGVGQVKWTRTIKVPAEHGGISCSGFMEELRSCDTGRLCPPETSDVDCVMSAWEKDGVCVPDIGKCGPGKQTWKKRILTTPSGRGALCPTDIVKQDPCDGPVCPTPPPAPVNCVVDAWPSWDTFENAVPCGTMQDITRTRSVVTPAMYGGLCTDPLTQTKSYESPPCGGSNISIT